MLGFEIGGACSARTQPRVPSITKPNDCGLGRVLENGSSAPARPHDVILRAEFIDRAHFR
ncbi:MAG: hypothetical protein K0S36_850 [Nitrosospira multiformis]|jgi:hypothetical protein|nr:hypothetical protein [Nitrosospira multiformis]